MADGEAKTQASSAAVGCVASVLLWVVLLLHFFADRIWDEEPAILKWGLIGYGCLILLGLLGSLVFGKRDEKVVALVLLTVVALFVAFIPPRQDRQAIAAVDALVRELSEKGAKIEQGADSLPEIPDQPALRDLERHLGQAIEQLQEQREWTADLSRRAGELLPRAPGEKREELRQALERFKQQAGRGKEKRDEWIKQVREKAEAQKKPGEPK
jgi:hypothetical protein